MNAPVSGSFERPPKGDDSAAIRVMIVDDSLTVRTIFKRMVESEGAMEVVATAASAERALAQLESTPVDVILLDGGVTESFAPCALAMVNVTIDQHRRIATQLNDAERILVSGLLEHQLAEAAHCHGRQVVDSATADGWVAALLGRAQPRG